MTKVLIYELLKDGSQVITVTCKLVDNKVEFSGNKDLISYLSKQGILDYSPNSAKKLFPADGIKFLEQLKNNFKSGYLNASDVIDD